MASGIRFSRKNSLVLVLSIVLFLALDMAMLVLNFRITQEVSEKALLINLSGRQRMLSQRMSKFIFQIDESRLASDKSQELLSRFLQTFQLFSDTLTAFQKGGELKDAELQAVSIHSLDSSEELKTVAYAQQLVSSVTPFVIAIQMNSMTSELLSEMKKTLSVTDEKWLTLMNELTIQIEKNSREQVNTLRTVQLVTFALALLNFWMILTLFIRMNRQSANAIRTLEELLHTTNAALIIFSANDKIIMCNRSAQQLFRYTEIEMLSLGRNDLFISDHEQVFGRRSDGVKFEVEMDERGLFRNDSERKLTVATVVDISAHVQKARVDSLTGLLNRTAFDQMLPYKIEQAKVSGQHFGCFFIDFDGFKSINDSYGHDVGDMVLKCFADRLKNVLRESDLAYRFGGDEFVLLVDLNAENPAVSIDAVSRKLKKVVQSSLIFPNDITIQLSISAGVSVYPDDASNLEGLLSLADQLMYQSKHAANHDRFSVVTQK